MKFKDIPKLTSVGTYQINTDLSYINTLIKDYIKEYGLQLNPDFQRGHVWTLDQRKSFVEFVLRSGDPGIFYFNKPDWMSFDLKIGYNDFVLVDGLQRLTSVLMFLNGELFVFNGCYLTDFEDKIPRLDMTFKINVNNLKTRKEVLRWYLEMNSGGTPHTIEEIEKVRNLLKEEE